MIATTEYVDGEQGNAYTESFRFLCHLSKKPDQNNVSDAEELFDIKTMQYAEEGSYKGWSIEAIQEHKMGVEPKIQNTSH